MHMPSNGGADLILKEKQVHQAKKLWSKLKPEQWPIDLQQLPKGTALVGGAVRDGLLDRLRERPDLDLVVPEKAVILTRKLADSLGGTCIVLDMERDIARLAFKGWTLDFACQEGANLDADLQRRDYRINAIALTLESNPLLLDPTGGIEDLRLGRLVAVHEQNLLADPLRLLRGLRLMAEMDLTLDPTTLSWIEKHHHLLAKVAPERIQAELQRLVNAPKADLVLPLLETLKLLSTWQNDALEHLPKCLSAELLNQPEQEIALPLARLTHLLSDEGMARLRFSRKQQQRCQRLRQWQQRDDFHGYETLSDEDRVQLHLDLEADLPALILQLPKAIQENWLLRWRNSQDPLFHPSPPVDGNVLQKLLELPPGPEIGNLIRHLCVEKAFRRIDDHEGAFLAARRWLKQRQKARCD